MLELNHGFRAVDVHARLEPDERAVAAQGRDVSPERLEREMHQSGLVRAVVSAGPREGPADYLRANNAVARLSVDRPLVAVARISGPRDPTGTPVARLRNLAASPSEHHTTVRDVERYGYDDRFHGFVLDPATDGLPETDVLEKLDDVAAPVFVHAGRGFPPAAVAETLLRYDFPVVLRSFGGHPLDRELMLVALDLLSDHDRLYLDTSAVRYRGVLEQGLLEHPDRVLFGSGAPDVHPDVAVMELLTLDVPEDAMRKAFSKNPARVVPALSGSEE
ncbi:amidohydrolase family protein [Halobium salinum]|uniref:Amidohydrolase family protein n=1 Tax=Halobium salinum TaxID=1364940 RepID=A0ABD5PGR9_9EURY|nr:amidohydrolase family protein [Halobium salinum]